MAALARQCLVHPDLAAGLLYAQRAGAFPASQVRTPSSSTSTLPYQGRLTDANGTPLDGTYSMSFQLYNTASGGSALWSEEWDFTDAVVVNDGLFNVLLGSLTPIPQNVITGNSSLWLGISIETDSEMTPRVQVGSVPFAFQANRAYGLAAADGDPQDAVTVDADGHIGIGTTSPLDQVSILGRVRAYLDRGAANATLFGTSDPGDLRFYDAVTTFSQEAALGFVRGFGVNSPVLYMYDLPGDSNSINFGRLPVQGNPATDYEPIVTIRDTGNVGIGTTDPNTRFEVYGGAWRLGTRSGGTYSGGMGGGFNETNNIYSVFFVDRDGTNWNNAWMEANSWKFTYGGNQNTAIYIAPWGDVGIGTNTPQHPLDVVGDIFASGMICANSGANCLSDMRLKTNIALLGNTLDKIEQIRGVSFDWNDEAASLGLSGETPRIGVIAQEVEAVFPEMVITMNNGYKAVDYSEFSAVLIEAIKELRAEKDGEIASLEAKNAVQQQTLTQLTTDNAALQEQVAGLEERLTALEQAIQSGQPVQAAGMGRSGSWSILLLGVTIGGLVVFGFYVSKRRGIPQSLG